MKAEVICFRPGQELMALIMSECHKREIGVTEYMIQLVYGALETEKAFKKVKEGLKAVRVHLSEGDDLEEAIEVLDAINQIIE